MCAALWGWYRPERITPGWEAGFGRTRKTEIQSFLLYGIKIQWRLKCIGHWLIENQLNFSVHYVQYTVTLHTQSFGTFANISLIINQYHNALICFLHPQCHRSESIIKNQVIPENFDVSENKVSTIYIFLIIKTKMWCLSVLRLPRPVLSLGDS